MVATRGRNSSGFRFAADDVCIIFLASQSCNKEQRRNFEGTGIFLDVKEDITDITYSIEITISNSITSYKFEKVSDTEIRWLTSSSASAVYVKQ